ncbi:hypothetical protein [Enterobacter phage vB_ExiM_F5M1E]|nr:hypothetical protein [Enterobacter phage vB_ExiM_F1M1E]UNA03110.1 hypothetical protein [Enterobacter phage vB_ExiM_F2M1E]UNA03431.1 hypothetical protein [Enterobacter phage vB_ExiM_F4M1E]UNA03752.1 hypothetical protein [Enterobacter phage vB_ExiM_F5M1E]UNA04072.1 hypothetical protein [Pantoea phage vB_PdiM_F5M2A]
MSQTWQAWRPGPVSVRLPQSIPLSLPFVEINT